ncbi:MAG: ATP-dependent DNA helicase RecG [Deltaproteobacteria bacterium]|nr:ATP-dependent DNA helicase RecG [Deltaproteobacteria bacterium]MBW2340239.1 ATP-dependent DNA helicase RecG [Deltaproteobacteria bacterium]
MEKRHSLDTNSGKDGPYQKILGPVSSVKGVGKVFERELQKRGVNTVHDLLYLLPRSYQDRRRFVSIHEIRSGESALIKGRILKLKTLRFKYRTVLEIQIGSENSFISARWMGAPQYLFRHKGGEGIILYGQFRKFGNILVTYHPEIIEKKDHQETGRLVPVYPEVEGISQRRMRRILMDAITRFTQDLKDPLPAGIREARGLLCLDEAFREAHFPIGSGPHDPHTQRVPALRRLIFDEFFMLQLALALKRNQVSQNTGIAFKKQQMEELHRFLPFELTASQIRVIREILEDMSRPAPMNRLLQGDVGCGKTAVALIAAWMAVSNGYQVAFMAPTQILAEQHYFSTLELIERLNLTPALLTSGMGARADEVRDRVQQGKVDILIGTHALIQEGVKFHRLGLVIIDEQHRFGVAQRALLKQKGISPDLLTMTATPIPRTLGLTLYGDLDISVIDELPVGRKPIHTRLFHEKDRGKVYAILREEINKGRQAYMVYPLIEESEKMDLNAATQMAEQLRGVLPEFRIALIHGRMPLDQRTAIMEEFKEGAIHILVATTVIEVGIDIRNATLIIIENAERFGLSQIHQLRGRVGRGSYPSQCVLVSPHRRLGDAGKRLRIIEKTTDGFRIAEEDLAIRGPGEFLGVKQSGFYQFRAGNIMRDARILYEARQEAFKLVEVRPELARETFHLLTHLFRRGTQGGNEFVDVL